MLGWMVHGGAKETQTRRLLVPGRVTIARQSQFSRSRFLGAEIREIGYFYTAESLHSIQVPCLSWT